MGTVIAASVGTSMSAATGRPGQSHLVYGTNNAKWYLYHLTGTQVLSLAYSTDFASWNVSGTTLTLTSAHTSEGRNFGLTYANLSSTDIVHMASAYGTAGTAKVYHTRFTLGATAWTVSNAEALLTQSAAGSSNAAPTGPTTLLDSGGRPFQSYQNASGDADVARATNADAGTSWTAGFATGVAVDSTMATNISSAALADLGATNVLNVCDDGATSGNFTQLKWQKYTGSWSATAAVLASTVTSTAANQWGMVGVSTSDIHVIALSNNSNTFVHRRFNGTAWATGQAIPNLTLHASSGIFLASNGTDLWAFAVDSSNNVQYVKWTAATPAWGAWTQLDAGGASARTSITGFPTVVNNTIGVVWTQANGANFDIVGTTLATGGAPAFVAGPPFVLRQAVRRAAYY